MRRNEKMVTVHEVLFHDESGNNPYGGAAGDGSYVQRFRSKVDADRFAARRTYYGKPCTVHTSDVPRSLASRWGVA